MSLKDQLLMVNWAEARRRRLRDVLDDLGRRMGAEGYIEDALEIDEIMERHGLFIVTRDVLFGGPAGDAMTPWTFPHEWHVQADRVVIGGVRESGPTDG